MSSLIGWVHTQMIPGQDDYKKWAKYLSKICLYTDVSVG